ASAADTVPGGVHYVSLALPGFAGITAGNMVATSVSFKPGFTWVANQDTLNTKGNELNFLSYQEAGNNAFPLEYKKRDYNCSYIVPTVVYYNTAGTWNGSFIPSFAYEGSSPDTYGFDHHLIYYHLNCASCFALSTNDIKKDGFAIGNAFPNPVATGTDVVLPITLESKEKIQVAVYNVIGQRMGSVIQPNLSTGSNEVKLSTRNLEAGVYFVTVTAGETVKTVRLVVNN
ncbi:MAG TPA: T9SS type A sorting domain-containing protein, partial [Bacteroidia bacterium]|nr:T9SS type A sorting domain-containing protein [Bacteroidia bacterium]